MKVPGLATISVDNVKETIDAVLTEPETASAVESKTIKLGMNPDEVKKLLSNPDKIVDSGAKQIYIYKDMKVIFLKLWCTYGRSSSLR